MMPVISFPSPPTGEWGQSWLMGSLVSATAHMHSLDEWSPVVFTTTL